MDILEHDGITETQLFNSDEDVQDGFDQDFSGIRVAVELFSFFSCTCTARHEGIKENTQRKKKRKLK